MICALGYQMLCGTMIRSETEDSVRMTFDMKKRDGRVLIRMATVRDMAANCLPHWKNWTKQLTLLETQWRLPAWSVKAVLLDAEAEVQRMGADRARLADSLDGAKAKSQRLESANREVSRRLVDAMESIRAVLIKQPE